MVGRAGRWMAIAGVYGCGAGRGKAEGSSACCGSPAHGQMRCVTSARLVVSAAPSLNVCVLGELDRVPRPSLVPDDPVRNVGLLEGGDLLGAQLDRQRGHG